MVNSLYNYFYFISGPIRTDPDADHRRGGDGEEEGSGEWWKV